MNWQSNKDIKIFLKIDTLAYFIAILITLNKFTKLVFQFGLTLNIEKCLVISHESWLSPRSINLSIFKWHSAPKLVQE